MKEIIELYYESEELAKRNAREFEAWIGYQCTVEFLPEQQQWKLNGQLNQSGIHE